MTIGTVAASAAKFCRTVSTATKNGLKYVSKESKEIFATRTQVGRRMREGVIHARKALKVKMGKLSEDTNMIEKARLRLSERGNQAVENLRNDKYFMETFEKYSKLKENLRGPGQLERRTAMKAAAKQDVPEAYIRRCCGEEVRLKDLKNLNNEEFLQEFIETSGVGPTKFAQIFSGDEKVLAQLERDFSPEFVKAMKNTKSKCYPTRSLEEAQLAVDNAFPGQNIKIKKQCGIASIGETYFVQRADGTEAVLKMIKNGVTKESLQLEEQLMDRAMQEFVTTPKNLEKYRAQMKNLYADWRKELSFADEFKYNKLLAKGAKRYSVANATQLSADETCLLMDKARGIKMEDLIKILEDYKANPTKFAENYAKEIAANPWLADPEKVARELPTTLLKTFDEQFMFLKKGGKAVMHGDPHMGNYFITLGKDGKLMPEFIDTGSCVVRSAEQVKDDIRFFSNYFVGNSRGVAEYFVKQCGYTRANKELITRQITKEIEKNIFGKTQNISEFSKVQSNIEAILEKYGLQMMPENSTAMKAQMQFFSAVSQSGKLTGQSLDMLTLMKDIPQASWSMIKAGVNPYSSVKDALKFAYHNQEQAVGTAYQFAIKDVDKVLKSDGTLEAIG